MNNYQSIMKRFIPLITFIILFIAFFQVLPAQSNEGPQGHLAGIIVEQATQNGIPGAHIVIQENGMAAVSGPDGTFGIKNLPAGIYSARVSFVGFRQRTLTDVIIRGNRTTSITIELREDIIEGEEVTVQAGYYHRRDTETVSTRSLNAEEIRRSPGGGQELARVISTTPGVATTGETSQDLMVRGGSPRENGFYIDNIFIPGIKHFEELDGSSNGPIGLVNTDLVDQLDFYAGGFSASYGGKMSSMANIHYREPSRERSQGSIDMSLAGFGGTYEQPVNKGAGSWLITLRRSYLDLIAGAINAGGAPRYGDLQAKGVYDIGTDNQITMLQILGDSRFTNKFEDAIEDGFLTVPDFRNRQNTSGLNWRNIRSDRTYSNLSLSWSFVTQELTNRYADDQSLDLRYKNRHDYLNIRNVHYHRVDDALRFEFGGDFTYTRGQFDYYFAPFLNEAGVIRPEVDRNLRKHQVTGELFGTMILRPAAGLTLNAGTRAGYNHINENITLSPRIAASWDLTHRLTFNSAAGIYRQDLPLYIRSQQPHFSDLNDPYAIHIIAGFDYLLGDATRFSAEVYNKQYRNLPIQPEGYTGGLPWYVFDTQMFYDELNDNGKGRARGIDLMLHRKIKKGVYGTISASIFRSEYLDHNDIWQSRNYDVQYLVSAIGGYRPNQKWEFSARWAYIGERPFTPFDIERSLQAGQAILDGTRFNSERLPAFHSLYARFNRRIFLDRATIVTFLELWNAYNRSNVEAMYWNKKINAPAEYHQFSILPVGGFTIEF